MLFVLYYNIISPARWVFMVGGPNGTKSGEEMIFSFVARGVYKVVRVSGKKKTCYALTTDFSRDRPGG